MTYRTRHPFIHRQISVSNATRVHLAGFGIAVRAGRALVTACEALVVVPPGRCAGDGGRA